MNILGLKLNIIHNVYILILLSSSLNCAESDTIKRNSFQFSVPLSVEFEERECRTDRDEMHFCFTAQDNSITIEVVQFLDANNDWSILTNNIGEFHSQKRKRICKNENEYDLQILEQFNLSNYYRSSLHYEYEIDSTGMTIKKCEYTQIYVTEKGKIVCSITCPSLIFDPTSQLPWTKEWKEISIRFK